MAYEIGNLPLETLIGPAASATEALARLDERLARSPVRHGWIERQHFADAAAALWLEGELVHLEDLVLHDAHMDIRLPTHELTRAHAVLRARRQIFANKPGWALGADGLRQMTRRNALVTPKTAERAGAGETEQGADAGPAARAEAAADELTSALAAVDLMLERSATALMDGAALTRHEGPVRSSLVHDLDWDEEARLAEWQGVMAAARPLPIVLRAAILLDAWSKIGVMQRAAWLGPLLVAALLRQEGIAANHLASIHLGAKLDAVHEAAKVGLKEHDRLMVAKSLMERRLGARRASSRMPDLIELVLSRPLVSSGMIQEALKVSKQGALNLVSELGLREVTGRGRYRAWAVI
jgi:Protein of unknown function (DUF1612)/HTH DNA binding domain